VEFLSNFKELSTSAWYISRIYTHTLLVVLEELRNQYLIRIRGCSIFGYGGTRHLDTDFSLLSYAF